MTAHALTLAINWPSIITGVLLVLFMLASLFLILVVLIQKPQGGGLTGAFGSGAGSGQTAFGARTGDALTVATIGFFVFYLATAIGLTYFMKPQVQPLAAPTLGASPSEAPPAPPASSAGAETPAPATPAEPVPAGTAPDSAPAAPSVPPAPPVPAGEPKADPAPKG